MKKDIKSKNETFEKAQSDTIPDNGKVQEVLAKAALEFNESFLTNQKAE